MFSDTFPTFFISIIRNIHNSSIISNAVAGSCIFWMFLSNRNKERTDTNTKRINHIVHPFIWLNEWLSFCIYNSHIVTYKKILLSSDSIRYISWPKKKKNNSYKILSGLISIFNYYLLHCEIWYKYNYLTLFTKHVHLLNWQQCVF